MRRPEVNSFFAEHLFVCLFCLFKTEFLSEPGTHWLTRLLEQRTAGIPYPPLSTGGITGPHYYSHLSTWVLEISTQAFMLYHLLSPEHFHFLELWAGGSGQSIKGLATRAWQPEFDPWENGPLKVILWPPHACHGTPDHSYTIIVFQICCSWIVPHSGRNPAGSPLLCGM